MDYRQNLAETLKLAKETSDLSLTAFAEKLKISKTQLVEFLNERGNPRMSTVLLIAEKLEINPADLLAPPFQSQKHPALELMLQTRIVLRFVAPQNRQAFVAHYAKMLLLMEDAQ